MASNFTLNLTRTFNGIETANLFVTPALKGQDWFNFVRVVPNVTDKFQMNFRPQGDKILKLISSCGFTPKGSVQITDKELQVQPVAVQLEQCERDLAQSIFEQEWFKTGSARTDLTGTQVETIVREFAVEGLMRDNARVMWWGESGAASNDWDMIDGWWRRILSGSSSLGHTFDMSTVETAGELDTDAGLDVFTNLERNMPAVMNEFRSDLAIYTTRGLVNNYRDTLQNTTTDFGQTAIINDIPRMAFNNIPIVQIDTWDTDLADADNPVSGDLNTTSNNVAFITTPDNLVAGTDAVGATRGTDAMIWFSMDNQTLRLVVNYKLGVQLLHENIISVAF